MQPFATLPFASALRDQPQQAVVANSFGAGVKLPFARWTESAICWLLCLRSAVFVLQRANSVNVAGTSVSGAVFHGGSVSLPRGTGLRHPLQRLSSYPRCASVPSPSLSPSCPDVAACAHVVREWFVVVSACGTGLGCAPALWR
mmetsp:Transcript_19095/g.48387  ORF Transcript_19095/g.48387 Transcript_19095/m.48387 type:complete len:144 (+) Transcript_19095:1699-2130(+)